MQDDRSRLRRLSIRVVIFAAALSLAIFGLAESASAAQGDQDVPRPQGVDAAGHAKQPLGAKIAADSGVGPAITRTEILARAQTWADAHVPYSQDAYRDSYRTDCSGYVSMAWHTNRNYWTGDLDTIGVAIGYADLRPGDMLLYHNAANPVNGSHVVLFDHWTGAIGGDFVMYEQTPPSTKHRTWSAAGYSRNLYKPFRYINVVEDASTASGTTGDLNNDGKKDLLMMDAGGDIYVYPGVGPAGSTQFGDRYRICYLCGAFDSMDVGDLNNDGKVDLVLREHASGDIYVYPAIGPAGSTQFGDRYRICYLCGSFRDIN
jgi:hypothetical protein